MADVTETVIEASLVVNEIPEHQSVPELLKQQSEEKTTNSHHHDSEYDTANYDTSDDDEDDDSLGQEDGDKNDDEGSSTGSEFDDDEERQRGDGQEQIDYMKKVDEDRSNPQYIPKKGTFYEHDDRTTDDPVSTEIQVTESTEGNENNTKTSTPTIASASKTMKKWQPASGMDRWSHDRFEETEQAPKSRAELVSAYGYDIRNEDGPPRSRRRRHYGRGPNKYSRNWEDEGAYIKANNAQRKPLRPEDFPNLGEKKGALNKNTRNFKEEKENHFENRKYDGPRREDGRSGGYNKTSSRSFNNRNVRSGNNNNRRSQDYKNNKSRSNSNFDGLKRNSNNRQSDVKSTQDPNCYDEVQSQMESLSFTNTKVVATEIDAGQLQSIQQLNNVNDHFNGYENQQNFHTNNDLQNSNLYNVQSQQVQQAPLQTEIPIQSSKLTSRLHHAQQRNDPSHVGSVQMHSLASPPQNQLPPNMVQPNITELHHPPQDQVKTKRYSSLRQRAANDASILQQAPQVEQQINMQQIHLQHDAAAQQLLLYHQQEQTQLQNMPLQNLAKTGPPPPQFQSQVPTQYAAPAPAFYTAPGDFGHGVAAPPSAPPMLQLTAAAAAAYMQQQQSVGAVQSSSIPQAANVPPAPLNYVQPQPSSAAQNSVPATPYQSYPPATPASQYSNYNTVGGTTYFVPHAQPTTRSTTLPQRRPTNAIPILAPPSDKSKQSVDRDAIDNSENIDHILDNMFVQRAPYIPMQTPLPTETPGISPTVLSDNKINEPFKNEDENKLMTDKPEDSQLKECVSPQVVDVGVNTSSVTEMTQTAVITDAATQNHPDN